MYTVSPVVVPPEVPPFPPGMGVAVASGRSDSIPFGSAGVNSAPALALGETEASGAIVAVGLATGEIGSVITVEGSP